jgi:hypothetical protein
MDLFSNGNVAAEVQSNDDHRFIHRLDSCALCCIAYEKFPRRLKILQSWTMTTWIDL